MRPGLASSQQSHLTVPGRGLPCPPSPRLQVLAHHPTLFLPSPHTVNAPVYDILSQESKDVVLFTMLVNTASHNVHSRQLTSPSWGPGSKASTWYVLAHPPK